MMYIFDRIFKVWRKLGKKLSWTRYFLDTFFYIFTTPITRLTVYTIDVSEITLMYIYQSLIKLLKYQNWNFLKKIGLHSNCRYCDPLCINENACAMKRKRRGGVVRRRREMAGREHSARKSLNLHESRQVVTFQCPLAFRSLKYRLISRNDWGVAASACKTRVVHQQRYTSCAWPRGRKCL